MSLWSRITNVLRQERLNNEIDEELQSHIDEAVACGRDPEEVRRTFGSTLQLRESSRDIRLLPWLDSLRADAIFGWRQLWKRNVTSIAAVLSLGLAIGACTTAFRLIDALLLRPLPVANAARLYTLSFQSQAFDGSISQYDSCSYPMFQRVRSDVHDRAEAIAVSLYTGPVELTYGSDQEMERVNMQYVSGWMFDAFALHPAAGRLLHETDDLVPGQSPFAVISYDYWTSRFARNPDVVGRTFRMANIVYQVVGVSEGPFTGTETGWATDVFIPMAMKNPRTLASINNFWLRTLLVLKPGVPTAPLEQQLRATFHSIQEERARIAPSLGQRERDRLFAEKLLLENASAGRSNVQIWYGLPASILALLVALVLLIACVNVANLMTAQSAARAREMALRISLGAGRRRLLQLILLEAAWLALFATVAGDFFAWWITPMIAGMINPPGLSLRLIAPIGWRVLVFSLALAGAVLLLFGLIPALRISAVRPMSVLRGGEEPRFRGRLLRALIAVQIAFSFVVHLAAGLFVTTFERLTSQPTGYSSERVLNLESATQVPQSPVLWGQVVDHLRTVPGVEAAALIGWPLMSGESAVGNISLDGGPISSVFSDFVSVSPGWADLMKIPILAGRDFHSTDVYPAVAIVNQSFVRQYYSGEDPIGKWFDRVEINGQRAHIQIVGIIGDARSRDNLRIPVRPTAYVPISWVDAAGAPQLMARGTFVVRTAASNPLTMASVLRQEVTRTRSEFRVREVEAQTELNGSNVVRERLLAILAAFFAGLALLLAGIGLYGVIDYSVTQRRREIGIRIAIGARAGEIVKRVIAEPMVTILFGIVAGVALGVWLMRFIQSILFGVQPTDPAVLLLPSLIVVGVALIAALPSVIRALHIDPVVMLRLD